MSRESDALDRHITGNYGEDQFLHTHDDPTMDGGDEGTAQCQVSNCEEETVDGVLCGAHLAPTPWIWVRVCPTRTPEVHELGEFPMSCYHCHIEADS